MLKPVFVWQDRALVRILPEQIICLSVEKNYIRIYLTDQSELMVRSTLANALNNLALIYRNQGRLQEAEPLYKRAIAIYDLNPGMNSVQANALRNYAELLSASGRTSEAYTMRVRANDKLSSG